MKSKKPNRTQRRLLEANDLDTRLWYIQKDTSTEMQIINIQTNEVKIILKQQTLPSITLIVIQAK